MVERGELNIRVDTIDKLSRLLHKPIEELLVNDPNREIKTTRIDSRN